ncbi:MAG: hypothetical protein ABI977_22070 [Acidobacteriota bacterium]
MPEQWQQAIAAFRQKVDTLPLKAVQEAAWLAGIEVVQTTPERTGHLKYNWQGSSGSPIPKERDGVDPGGGLTTGEIARAILAMKSDQVFYLANPTSYGVAVEHGSDTQEARLWVAAVKAKWQKFVTQAIADVKR